MKLIWKPITECDDDNGNHTVWSTEVNHATYGRYLWISMDDGLYTEQKKNKVNYDMIRECAI